MPDTILQLPPSAEKGSLQVMHLKRYWSKSLLRRNGALNSDSHADEWKLDTLLLNFLGLGLEQTIRYIYSEGPSFGEFENWIATVAGQPEAEKIVRFNQLACGAYAVQKELHEEANVLNENDHAFWEKNGYVIVKNAINIEDCNETIAALCEFIGIVRDDPNTWYNTHPARQGIMVQLFQHPVIEKNRTAPRVRKAFEEIWKRKDIWVNADRVGFNPPETPAFPFQGPRLHWDTSIYPPIPFGTQGILYLSDTAANQGAFTLVPGFQHTIEAWLKSLPAGADPRQQDLYALDTKPIAAGAGDLIIWHHALPHGSSPNTSQLPRFVQYINYEPANQPQPEIWL